MAAPHVLKALYRSGIEFWLPLPLIAVLCWVLGSAMTNQVLNRSHNSVDKLQADTQTEDTSETILAINAEIDPGRGITTLVVRVVEPTMADLNYEFPIVDIAQLEMAIAQELNLSIATVRRLASYRMVE